mgnify:CR=1 FL=1
MLVSTNGTRTDCIHVYVCVFVDGISCLPKNEMLMTSFLQNFSLAHILLSVSATCSSVVKHTHEKLLSYLKTSEYEDKKYELNLINKNNVEKMSAVYALWWHLYEEGSQK